jgi:hypothetical protein
LEIDYRGAAGTVIHFLFMHLKSWTGLLPSFQPYQSFQIALSHWVGTNVPAVVPWTLSFLNGMTILGFLFARINRLLPGRSGAVKGVTFGLIGWVFMGLIFFPLRPIRHECWFWVRTSAVIVSDVADLQHRAGHGLCRTRCAKPVTAGEESMSA